MLMDLSKEIMMDLGITVIGDIIAILKHAKQVYRQVRRQLVYSMLLFRATGNALKIHQSIAIDRFVDYRSREMMG